jgi:hypothetical protein
VITYDNFCLRRHTIRRDCSLERFRQIVRGS